MLWGATGPIRLIYVGDLASSVWSKFRCCWRCAIGSVSSCNGLMPVITGNLAQRRPAVVA
ncbi:hypothetical protein KCP70_16265 [Salmonella enterica subsp. enterica]|nr:hypothetical protein KCP70_16265 [Salmonella enterica subsp. enterica]